MSRNRIMVIIGTGLVLVVVALGLAGWSLGYFEDAPEEANVEDLAVAVQAQNESDDGTDGGADQESAETGPIESLDGTWTVSPVEGLTFLGYRINEELTTIGDFTVVGRTPDVTGTLIGDGTTITSVEIVGDMTTITTDNGQRDNAMRRQALETDQFPEATFVLAEPIDIGTIPDQGVTIEAVAVGDLTIHGVTRRVEFPLEAQIQGGAIVVVGQLDVALADFEIEAPSAPIVASVEDTAILELSLAFTR